MKKRILMRPRKKFPMFPEMRVSKKNFTRVEQKNIFLMNLIEFYTSSLHLRIYSNSTFLCWLRHKNIFQRLEKILDEREKLNIIKKDLVNKKLRQKFQQENLFFVHYFICMLNATRQPQSCKSLLPRQKQRAFMTLL